MRQLNPKLAEAIKIAQIVVIIFSAVLLLVTIGLLILESTWVKPRNWDSKQEAFLYGLTGTELMPLPVLQVLPNLFPENFQPAGKDAGDWVQQFGFIRGREGVNEGLPLGFSVSHYRPKSGAPSPVAFVGFSCSLCHVGELRPVDGREPIRIEGMGNSSLDFIAWVDAVRSSILDEKRFTVAAISDAYERRFGHSLRFSERMMIAAWLPGARKFFKDNLPKYDAPYSGKDLRDSSLMPNGPARTQPFR